MFKDALDVYDLPEDVEIVDKSSRDKGVGGSDIAALFAEKIGFKHGSPLTVFYEKTGRKIDDSNQFTKRGLERERVVKEWVLFKLGLDVYEFAGKFGEELSLRRKDKPHLVASLDGLVVKDKRLCVLEVKTCNKWSRKKWFKSDGKADVPKNYFLQVQWYMHISKLDKAVIVCEVDNWECVDENRRCGEEERYEYVIREVDVDKKLGVFLEGSADRFWIENIQNLIPPNKIGLDCEKPYLKAFENNIYGVGVLSDELEQKIALLESRKKVLKEIEKEIKSLEEEVKLEIVNFEEVEGKNYKVAYKQQVRFIVDSALLKAAHKDVYDAVKKETKTRILKILKIKEKEK